MTRERIELCERTLEMLHEMVPDLPAKWQKHAIDGMMELKEVKTFLELSLQSEPGGCQTPLPSVSTEAAHHRCPTSGDAASMLQSSSPPIRSVPSNARVVRRSVSLSSQENAFHS